MKQKRVVTIQDISCFGKCSLTVALPLLSAMGVECAVLPTAVLSTHTGGFTGWTFRDLTEDIEPIFRHWQKEKLEFDGLYTGYLASPEQAAQIETFIDAFHPSLVFVDPAMADNGKLYPGLPESLVPAMRHLVSIADIAVPNITEASLLTGIPYRAPLTYDRAYIEEQLHALCALGVKKAAITGVRTENSDREEICLLDGAAGTIVQYDTPHLPVSCHGTGDVYASVLFGCLIRGMSDYDSIRIAAETTVCAIRATMNDPDHWYGVRFEDAIPTLLHEIGLV